MLLLARRAAQLLFFFRPRSSGVCIVNVCFLFCFWQARDYQFTMEQRFGGKYGEVQLGCLVGACLLRAATGCSGSLKRT